MRNIGDKVWIPNASRKPVYKQCPDCLGTARWHCSLPNGENFDIECPRCHHGGYKPSDGIVCEEHIVVEGCFDAVVMGMEMRDGVLEYRTDRGSCLEEIDLCDTREEAIERSKIKMKKYSDAEDRQMSESAKKKGRPQKDKDGNREANDMDLQTQEYARKIVRDSIKEAQRWIEHAKLHGTVIDLQDMIRRNDRCI